MKQIVQVSLCALLLISAATSSAQDTLLVLADKLYTAGPQGVINNAVVVIESGKIRNVGSANVIRLTANARRLQAAVVTPGLIDTRTTVGLSGAYNVPADQDHNETTDPNTAGLRALDGFNPHEPMLATIRNYGVTTIQTGPGDLNPIAGRSGIFKTFGRNAEQMVIEPVSAMVFNLGERPKATYGEQDKTPATRMAIAALIRTALAQAQDQIHGAGNTDEDKPLNLNERAMQQVIKREIVSIFTAHREDDIATAIRICEEFKLRCQLAYATEGYLMRSAIKQANLPVLLGPTLQRLDGLQTLNASLEAPALLAAADIPIAFSSGHEAYVPKNRILLFEIAMAVANGLNPERAIRAATIDAASMLGIARQTGSVEIGKDADLVLFDGDPFEYTNRVQNVIIDGVIVNDVAH